MLTTLLISSVLFASDNSRAADLFARAREQMRAHHPELACPLFQESQRLEPALGTLLNWGLCLEETGRGAEAWPLLDEAARWAERRKDRVREKVARDRLGALRQKLAFVSVRGVPPTGLVLTLEGREHALDTSSRLIAVTPGAVHLIFAGGGARPKTVELVAAPGSTNEIAVPSLEAPPVAPELRTPDLRTPEPAPVAKPEPLLGQAPSALPLVRSTGEMPAPRRGLLVTGLVGGVTLTVAGAAGVAWSFVALELLHRQQPGGPDAARPTITRSQAETLQWLFPASWCAVGLGVASTALFGVMLRTPAQFSVVPTQSGVTFSFSTAW